MRYLWLFVGQGLNFLLAVVNIRAASHGKWLLTGLSDFVFCVVNFLLIQRIAVANDWGELLAYAMGGGVGSIVAMFLTRRWGH